MTFSFKKKTALVATFALSAVLAFALAGCGAKSSTSSSSKSNASDDKTITVAATPSPHAEILNDAVKPLLEKEGYTLVVKEFTDYVQPNNVVDSGDCYANYFQHQPYLDDFNKENGTHVVSVASIHVEPMGVYAGKETSLDILK